jgi:uncharacterized protein YkwD
MSKSTSPLLALFCIFSIMACGMSSSAQLPPATGAVNGAPAQLVRMEERVRQRINEMRREHGLDPLQSSSELAHLAREHSRRMAEENFFAHVDPEGRSLIDRLREAGIDYRAAAENISSSTNVPDPVDFAVNGWMESPGHRANILRPEFNATGVGIWREGDTFYFTQVFLRGS